LGSVLAFDEDVLFPNREQSITESRIRDIGGFRSLNGYSWQMIGAVFDHYNVDVESPITEYPDKFWEKLLFGTGKEKIKFEINGDRYEDDDYHNGRALVSWKVDRPFEGILTTLQRRYMGTSSEGVRNHYETFMNEYYCNGCKGQRLKPVTLAVTLMKKNIWDICKMSVSEAIKWFKKIKITKRDKIIVEDVLKEIFARYSFLENVGLDYITLDRLAKTLSGGESERIRLATQIGSNLVGVLYVLDEPTIGLHSRDKYKLINMLKELRDKGNTVLIVEHDEDVIREADFLVDIGPGAGVSGGEIVATGTVDDIIRNERSLTGKYLSGELKIDVPTDRRIPNEEKLKIVGARKNNLKNVEVSIPLGLLTCITGVSGAGKSSLIEDVLVSAVAESLRRKKRKRKDEPYDKIEGLDFIDKLINIDQTPIGRTPRSVPSTYTKAFDIIRDLFAQTEEAKIRGYKKGRFSFNMKGGRCEKCGGKGFNLIEMHFLPDVYVKCDVCKGSRYNEETLEVKYNGKNIYEVLRMTHNQALEFFGNHPRLSSILQTVVDVGLGYIELGQSSTTLSGGEAQRMKLSRELSKRSTGNTLYILDEPTTGLHFHDVKILINVLQYLVDKGNTIVVIEHNLDVVKSADYIIDLGPEGGDKGGRIIATGTPEDVAAIEESYTGNYLKSLLNND
jgi:excinuclease ABC subunit A